MKQFIVDRHTTPNTPKLEQVPTEKIPIYENRAAVTADLANLSEGQIVATKDTGDELSQPVDVVESGNLHAVSSDAVAESLSYSTTEQKTGGVWIDGKPIYKKVIDLGTFPNADTKRVASGIVNIDRMINLYAIGKRTNGAQYIIPYVYDPITYGMTVFFDTDNTIAIQAGTDRRDVTGYAVIEYTKTTD